MFDVKIINGTIVDGTGKPAFQGQIGIKDGKITEVGACDGPAKKVIDAEGALVTPGFTDIHTHYDGQISWDKDLAPSSVHGVTTCVMGSCGVGFAPVKEKDRDRLIRIMEGVEDIPGTALAEGLTWNWESLPEYMDAIDSFPHAIDFAVQATHDALRVYVMGDRATSETPATDEDIAAMRDLVRDALKAGAVGFSTGRTDNHRSAEGHATPASEAQLKELVGIAEAFKGLDHGVLQAVSDFDMAQSPERFEPEWQLLEEMLKASGGHPMSISLMQRDQAPTQWQQIMRKAEEANEKGLNIRLQTAPRGIGVMLGLEATFHPFIGFPSYKKISALSLEERVKEMKKPEFRAQILTEKSDKVSGDGSSIPPLADHLLGNLELVAKRLYRLGENPNYEPAMEDCLYAEAMAQNKTMLEVLFDAMLEQDGHALLYFPIYNYSGLNLDAVREMMTHPLALPGLSDGGAHVGTVCDASFPTFLLSHWGKNRGKDLLPIEQLVHMQAYKTARFIGFTDRGELAPGQKADINIIDFDQLSLNPPRLVNDLPAGGKRLLQDAKGYRMTLLNGEVIAENGKLNDLRIGRLARLGQ
ncbi:MAG: amidohydrolase family protein [Planctomycetota bacterium]|nr:amidohydrolase family protein [Planctomycetota bacterium]